MAILSNVITPSNVLTASSTNTVTNKTISGASNTINNLSLTSAVTGTLPIANGGTNTTATPTAGGIAYGTGSAYAITSAGTAGQVLLSNGASAPSWGATTLTFISTQTASASASLQWTGLATYDKYLLVLQNIVLASGDVLGIQFGTGSTPTYFTSGYAFLNLNAGTNSGNTAGSGGSTNTSHIRLDATAALTSTGAVGMTSVVMIQNVLSTTARTVATTQSFFVDTSGNYVSEVGGGTYISTSAARTAIRLITNGGANIASGTASLYGIS